MKKNTILLLGILIAVILYAALSLLFLQKTKAPEIRETPTVNFKGPTGVPYVKGPTAPPPGK